MEKIQLTVQPTSEAHHGLARSVVDRLSHIGNETSMTNANSLSCLMATKCTVKPVTTVQAAATPVVKHPLRLVMKKERFAGESTMLANFRYTKILKVGAETSSAATVDVRAVLFALTFVKLCTEILSTRIMVS